MPHSPLDRARFIGAFLGDGWVRQNPKKNGHTDYAVGLAIGQIDQPHTEKYLELVRSMFPGNWKNNPPRIVGLVCSSKRAHRAIVGMGISGYCDQKRVPQEIIKADLETKKSFFGGFMDADGHVLGDVKNLSRGHIGSCNIDLLTAIREIGISVGLSITPIRTYDRPTNIAPYRQIFHQCWVSGLTMWKIPMWHETKSTRSKLLFAAQEHKKHPRYAREDSGTWKSTPHIIKNQNYRKNLV